MYLKSDIICKFIFCLYLIKAEKTLFKNLIINILNKYFLVLSFTRQYF